MMTLISKLRRMLSPAYKWGLLLVSGCMVLGALLELAALGMVMAIVTVFTSPAMIQEKWYLDCLYRFSGVGEVRYFLILLALLLIVFYFIKNLYGWILLYFQGLFVARLTVQIVRRIYHNYLLAPYTWHVASGASSLIDRLTRIETLCNGLLRPLMLIGTECCVLLILGAVLFAMIPWIVLGIFCSIIILFFVFYLPLRKKITRYGEINNQASAKSVLFLTQGISAVKEVKLTGTERYFEQQLTKEQMARFLALKRIMDFSEIPRFAMETFCIAIAMGVLIILLALNMPMEQILIYAALFVTAMFRLLPSFSRIQYNIYSIRGYMPLFEMVYNDLCNLPQEDKHDIEEDQDVTITQGITIENMDFGYAPDQPLLFRDFSMTITPRESVAFVGKTGSGKTTLADIIMGFYHPRKGCVKVDGKPIETILKAWREKIGYVPQNMTLFNASVRHNIAFGIPDDQIDDNKLRKAMDLAQVTTFVDSLPEKENTVIGEAGLRLSGGQRQRIVIARALYREPELLILDEATSALDNDTEKAIIDALKTLKGKLTIIMIAHRLSSIEHCDRVISLDK